MYRIARIQPSQGQALRTLRLESLHHNNSAFAMSQTQLLGLSHDQWEQVCSANTDGQTPAIYLAWHDHTAVGMAGITLDASPKLRHVGTIWGVYVAPSHRRNSLGTMLMQHIIAHGTTLGVHMLKLTVTVEQPAAITLYQSLGFERYAYEPALLHINGVDIDALHMRYLYRK